MHSQGLMDESQVFQEVPEERWLHWKDIISQGDRLLMRIFCVKIRTGKQEDILDSRIRIL